MRILQLVLLGVTCLVALPQQRQSDSGDQGALRPFLGTWKGVCADGKAFVIVTLAQEGGSLEGSVRLANMRGGDDGQCTTVVDPPSDKHSLSVTDAKLTGPTLTFKGSKRMEFEMTVQGSETARLKFIGTASEDNPWELKRAR
jgi:hypothetical protein